ncbi:MAG: glycosyltransferase [Myxococcales bacterium]|nr:glycosyltransferase [Myxococcales bacterium]
MTPVFNGAKHLEASIESVRAQTYPHIEHIVVDGGSVDDTLHILAQNRDTLTCWTSERDRGCFDAMNRGIALATGAIVKVHAADDLMPPRSVEVAVAAFMDGRAALGDTIVRGHMEVIDAEEQRVRLGGPHSSDATPSILHPTWFVPMPVYERLGLYDPSSRVSADYEMYFHALRSGIRFVDLDELLSRFRTGGLSASWGGLGDTFAINRRYVGLAFATYVAADSTVRGLGKLALTRLFGERRTANLRSALREGFRS